MVTLRTMSRVCAAVIGLGVLFLAVPGFAQDKTPDVYAQSIGPGPTYGVGAMSANDCRMVTRGGSWNTNSTNLGAAADDLVLVTYGNQVAVQNVSATSAPIKVCFAHTTSIALSAFTGVEGGYSTWDSANSAAGPVRCVDVPGSTGGVKEVIKVSRSHFPCFGADSGSAPGCRLGRCTSVVAVTGPDPVEGSGCLSNAECGTGVCSFAVQSNGQTGPTGVHMAICTGSSTDQVVSVHVTGL